MFLEGCGEKQSVQWGPLVGQSEQSFSILRHASESLGFLNGEAFLDVSLPRCGWSLRGLPACVGGRC